MPQSDLPERAIRVSDPDRDAVVERLKDRIADGTLSLEEFAERVDRALVARSRGELDALVVDLPAATAAQRSRRSPTHRLLAVMSGAQTKGRWVCGARVSALAVMGGCEIDFRGAEIAASEVHVTAVAVMGGIDIVVPEGIAVSMDGLPVMGGRSMKVKDVPILPGSPRIHVHAYAIMGGVSIRSRARKPEVAASPEPAEPAAAAILPGTVAETVPLDGTVTIMFSDICDYSGITDRLGDERAHELLREHNTILRGLIQEYGGREVKASGDGFMVAFGGAARALRCAIGLQRALSDRNATTDGEPIRVHIGVHAGDVVRDGDDYLGGAVIIASRLVDVAGPDEILVSSVARDLAGGSREFDFEPARTLALKGFAETRNAHPVRWRPGPRLVPDAV